jgi:hypothetical protein
MELIHFKPSAMALVHENNLFISDKIHGAI